MEEGFAVRTIYMCVLQGKDICALVEGHRPTAFASTIKYMDLLQEEEGQVPVC
jgi:hypothetical protein